MKKLIIILVLLPHVIFAQPWLKTINLPDWTAMECIMNVISDYDRGSLLSIDVANFSPRNVHNIIYKYDDNAEIEYELLIGSGNKEETGVSAYTVSQSGDIVLVGAMLPPQRPGIVALDSCRNKKWCTILKNSSYYPNFFLDLVLLEDGSTVAVSIQNDTDIFNNIHLHKFNNEGELLWRKTLFSKHEHPKVMNASPNSLIKHSDGGYLVTGTCYWPNPDDTLWVYVRMFMVKADSQGNEEWVYVHGMDDYHYSQGLYSQEYNNAIYSDGLCRDYGYPDPPPQIIKTTLDGTHLFDTIITAPDVNNRRLKGWITMSEIRNDFFYASLWMYPLNSFTDSRAAFAKMDTLGVIHEFFMPDTVPALIYAGYPYWKEDGKILVTGATAGDDPDFNDVYIMRLNTEPLRLDTISWTSYNYDSLCSQPIESHVITLGDCSIIVNNEDFSPPAKTQTLGMLAMPQPAVDELKIALTNTILFRNITVRCYNMLGNEIDSFGVNSGTNEKKVDIAHWPAGLYIAVAYSNNSPVGSCKILKVK